MIEMYRQLSKTARGWIFVQSPGVLVSINGAFRAVGSFIKHQHKDSSAWLVAALIP